MRRVTVVLERRVNRRGRWLYTASATLATLVASCAARSGGPHTTPAARASTPTHVERPAVKTDDYGDLRLEGARKQDGKPAWLVALHPGDQLEYTVTDGAGDSRRVVMRVQSIVKRGDGVAALLQAEGEIADAPKPRWVAGDGRGLYQLPVHDALVDPELPPLDEAGNVLDTSTPRALWMLPSRWAQPSTHSDTGWQLEELDLSIEGAIEGDRCAQMHSEGAQPARWSICESVGVVEREPLSADDTIGTWKLQRVVRAPTAPASGEGQAARAAKQ